VRADPKPDDDGAIENTQSAVAESDANGIDVFRLFYFLEAKARVTRITAEKPVGLPCLSGGFWGPDGAYTRLVSPIIGIVWVLVVSWVLMARPATRAGW